MYRLDSHIHCQYSPDSSTKIDNIIKKSIEDKIDIIAISDHNTVEGSKVAVEKTKDTENLLVIPSIEISSSKGHILGFVKDVAPYIKVKKVKLSEGDIVMIVTDGIIDTKSLRGDIFGKTRTQTALMENSGYPAEKMAKFTYDALVEFTSKELENDITILVMKYLGNQAQA